MDCCKKSAMSTIYTPLDKRLLAFGKETYSGPLLEKFKNTKSELIRKYIYNFTYKDYTRLM